MASRNLESITNMTEENDTQKPDSEAVDPATPLFGGSRAELLLAVISELGEAHQRTANIVDGLPLLCRRSRHTLIAEMCTITTAIDSFGDALMSEPNNDSATTH